MYENLMDCPELGIELGYGRGFPATASPPAGGVYKRSALIVVSETPTLYGGKVAGLI